MRPSLYSVAQQEIAALLRDLRTKRGLTQAWVAAQLDRPQTYVSDLERGVRSGTLLQVRELAAVYDVQFVAFARELEKRIARATSKTKSTAKPGDSKGSRRG
ncbi:helix-turn-helix domain-containing protein [Dokdonella sp.]|uniref:helix-turn-helix domain-containing protein n=1 Tax=Dokdonella sp. TaxID=2291710 RepID=UPI0037837969